MTNKHSNQWKERVIQQCQKKYIQRQRTKKVSKGLGLFGNANDYRIYNAPKKKKFARSIPILSTCPARPSAEETIFVAIPFDLLGRKGAMMQKANVNHGKIRWTRW
jgi:hypothetical protein